MKEIKLGKISKWFLKQSNVVHNLFFFGIPLAGLCSIMLVYWSEIIILPEIVWMIFVMICFPIFPMLVLTPFIKNDRLKKTKRS